MPMPKYDFSGKVAFITGGARGAGKNHALTYAENDADVVIFDIAGKENSPEDMSTSDQLNSVAEKIEKMGQNVLAIQGDVSNETDVERAMQKTIDEFGKIDFLANNAGVGNVIDMVDMTEEQWDWKLDVDLKGVWLCTKHAARHMIDGGQGGKIINTSSVGGLTGDPGLAHHTAAKHGVIGFTKTAAIELAEHNINVNAVCPTAMATETFLETGGMDDDPALSKMKKISGPSNLFEPGTPIPVSNVSQAHMYLSSEAADYVTGIAFPVDAGSSAK